MSELNLSLLFAGHLEAAIWSVLVKFRFNFSFKLGLAGCTLFSCIGYCYSFIASDLKLDSICYQFDFNLPIN